MQAGCVELLYIGSGMGEPWDPTGERMSGDLCRVKGGTKFDGTLTYLLLCCVTPVHLPVSLLVPWFPGQFHLGSRSYLTQILICSEKICPPAVGIRVPSGLPF